MLKMKCIGQLTIDDTVFPNGTTSMGTMGGNSIYSAAGAALWCDGSVEVGLVSRVGNDYPPEFIERMKGCGFHVDSLHPIHRSHMHFWYFYEGDGSRRSLCRNEDVLPYPPISVPMFEKYLQAFRKVHLENSPLLSDLPKAQRYADAYHIAPQNYDRQLANLKEIRRVNPQALVSLDPSNFYMYQNNFEQVSDLLKLVDIFLPSEEEIYNLFGRLEPEEAAKRLAQMGPKIVVIKLGAKGSYVLERETGREEYFPIFPTSVIDETGAGDTYCGGFLSGYLQSGDIEVAGCSAVISAARTISGLGTDGILKADREAAIRDREQLFMQRK